MEKIVTPKQLQSRFANIEMSLAKKSLIEVIDLKVDIEPKSSNNTLVNHNVLDLKTAVFKILTTGSYVILSDIKRSFNYVQKTIEDGILESKNTFKTSIINYSKEFPQAENNADNVVNENHNKVEKIEVENGSSVFVGESKTHKAELSFLGFFEKINTEVNKFEIEKIEQYDLFFTHYFEDFYRINELLNSSKMNKNIKKLSVDLVIKENRVHLSLNYIIDIMPERWCRFLMTKVFYELNLKTARAMGNSRCVHEYNVKNKVNRCQCIFEIPLSEKMA